MLAPTQDSNENYYKLTHSIHDFYNKIPSNSPLRRSFIKSVLPNCDVEYSSQLLGINRKTVQRVFDIYLITLSQTLIY